MAGHVCKNQAMSCPFIACHMLLDYGRDYAGPVRHPRRRSPSGSLQSIRPATPPVRVRRQRQATVLRQGTVSLLGEERHAGHLQGVRRQHGALPECACPKLGSPQCRIFAPGPATSPGRQPPPAFQPAPALRAARPRTVAACGGNPSVFPARPAQQGR